ncbi:uncharacterized protein LOC114549010 isoform X2 [Perca flavescens]|uniref:uncharacterized protein LOC114549010 isoform X2 n=1 Tax=Perca flavescens TaxID=8167 RepID=UPI00106E2F3E|nr:uncharacterized protein LOC114549010 isoform X2 [Perca flavescens]
MFTNFHRSQSARTTTSTGRRNVEVKSEESSSERVELTVGGVKTSKPEMLFELSSGSCEDGEAFRCRNGLFESPSPLRLSPATAAAQTQMPGAKPKARTLVACRQLTDGNEAASLKDQSPLPLLTLTGTVSLASTDPRRPSSVHASITHIDTMRNTIWGMPGCGAPNYHLGTVKRTKSLGDAGILPQEQTRDKGFSGTPFHRP